MNKLLKYIVLLICTISTSVANGATYYLTSAGASTAQTPSSWNTIQVGGGTAATNFTTSNDIFIISSGQTAIFTNTTFASNVTLQVENTGIISLGSGIILNINGTIHFNGTSASQIISTASGTGVATFNLNASSNLRTSNINGLQVANGSIPINKSNGGSRFTANLSTSANYEFNSTANQSTTGLPTTVANLIIGPKTTAIFASNQVVTGTLTIKSNATGTGSIGNSAGTITGTIKVERYIPANRKFRFLSSPVVGGTATQWRNNNTNVSGIGTQITGNGPNFDPSGSNNPSAFSYNEVLSGSSTTVGSGAANDPGWTAFTDGNMSLVNGKGYRVLVRGDRSIDLINIGNNAMVNNTTIYTSGTYPTMPVITSVTKTGTNINSGFNLVGNPVPSSISWNAITKTNVAGTYYTYNPTSGYVSWNGTIGSAGDIISSSQGFFVVATAATGNIRVSESCKSAAAGSSFFKKRVTNCLSLKFQYVYPDSTIPLPDLECSQYINLREDAADTFEMDKDGFHLTNPGINFYSLDSSGIRYSINCLSVGDKNVKLGISNTVLANYKLYINGISSFFNTRIYLKDSLMGNIYEITSDTFSLNINHDAQSSFIGNNRFEIIIRSLTNKVDTKFASNSTVSIYPNPTINKLNIVVNKPVYTPYSYEIYTQSGSKITSGILDYSTNQIQSIQTDELSSGIYILRVANEISIDTLYFIK